jgi:hypothetical protein
MPEKTTIYQKLIKFQSEMSAIKKNSTNPHFKSPYATLDQIQSSIQKTLTANDLGYTQEVVFEEDQTKLLTTLFDVDGNEKKTLYPISIQGTPQQVGSAMTYAKRYSLTALLGLIIEGEDDDGNEAQNQPKTEVTWLTNDQFAKTKISNDVKAIELVIKSYSTATHKMSRAFKEQLQHRINELQQSQNLPDPDQVINEN